MHGIHRENLNAAFSVRFRLLPRRRRIMPCIYSEGALTSIHITAHKVLFFRRLSQGFSKLSPTDRSNMALIRGSTAPSLRVRCLPLLHAGLVTALAILCITAAEAGRTPAQGSPNATVSDCSPPPTGTWLVVHNFPDAPNENTLFVQARTVLTITTTAIPGVYTGRVFAVSIETPYQAVFVCCSGTGGGIVSNRQNPVIPFGFPILYSMIGIFNEELCAIMGTVTISTAPVVEPFIWYYDGEATMTGPYATRNNGTLPFTTLSRHDLHYIGSS